MIGLEEKLRTEIRICPQCRNPIENPFAARCPRCLTIMPVSDPGCRGCVHNSGCPVASFKSQEESNHQR
jgi:hypothetical protein